MTKARDISKLSAVEVDATADQTNAEVKAAAEAASDSNTFTDADHSKLNAIEASADVTDTANVTSSGALMDSELTNLAAVKAINQSLVTTASPTFASVVVDNITIDGTQIDLSSGDLTLDVAGSIKLDADSSNIYLADGGTDIGLLSTNNQDLNIRNVITDKDIYFQGNDGGSTITALTLSMANAGAATFNDKITATELDISGNVDIDGTTNLDAVDIDGAVQIDAAVSVGVNDTGYDVKFFGATASAYMEWDASADDLILGGAGRVVVPDGQLVLGSTAVTSTAAELNLVDGITAGTVIASKAIITDSNIDITGGRNITISGELDAATGDFSGNVDIDGTLSLIHI